MNCFYVFANKDIEQFFSYIDQSKYKLSHEIIKDIANDSIKKQLDIYYDLVYNTNKGYKIKINTNEVTLETNLKLLNKGLSLYIINGNEIQAIKILKEASILAKKRNDNVLFLQSLKLILEIYQRFSSIIEDYSYTYFLDEYAKVASNKSEQLNLILKSFKLKRRFHRNNKIEVNNFYNEKKVFFNNISNPFLNAKIKIELSAYNLYNLKNVKKSKSLIVSAIENLKILNKGVFEKERLISAYINLSIIQFNEGNFQSSIKTLESINITNNNYLLKLIKPYKLYWLYKNYDALGNKVNSLENYNKYLELELLNDQSNKIQLVSEYETKYQTEKKEKQILIEQQKKKQNRNIALGLGGLLLFGGITFLLIQKNTKRKQLLAVQEKELETQKLATVLKEQELVSIDAMIEGQEKERQRIANDLHDDLGGLMATVKLHFNALKEKQSPELYKKTDKLLDEAYNKIRSVAHTKNSGVMAKKGLLKAVNDMAKTISASNKLRIDVIDHGLENRLENSLELTIFRIIQELVTNIIKHAEATEATIHITNHDDSLNIMVEDNGKGFNTKKISKNTGMGIHSIDKRIENLGGTVTIESEKNKGTTVIIDIPS